MKSREEELMNIFSTAIENKTVKCTKCDADCKTTKKNKYVAICKWKACKVKVSLLKDTPFYCEKTSILDILLTYNNKTLSIVENTVYNLTGKIGGPGIIVEIDESKFGKVKYHKGHRVDGVWVFGMVERTTQRKIVMIPVDNRRADTLEEIIKNYVHRESIIHSDCFKSYSKLKDIFAEHKTVNHSIEFVNNINSCHTNTIEGNWFGIKNETSVNTEQEH
ncbi:DDE-TNP-IS1595 domain-containing protein [Vairimorpha necatrix]|uniref:DDE-TNP-IS1595 domain-containing protein n=1 Tax=Vairimorpha necatrix TaxID=6039 RepID=A0AAX4JB77_9MICR